MLAPTRTSHSSLLCLTSSSPSQCGLDQSAADIPAGPDPLNTESGLVTPLSLPVSLHPSLPSHRFSVSSISPGPFAVFTQTRQDHTSRSSPCSPSYTISSSKSANPLEVLVYPVLIPLPSSYCAHNPLCTSMDPSHSLSLPLECKFCEDMGVFLPFLYYHSAGS